MVNEWHFLLSEAATNLHAILTAINYLICFFGYRCKLHYVLLLRYYDEI
jgi:hypothetical protein